MVYKGADWRQRFSMQDAGRQRREKELVGFKAHLEEKTAERERILGPLPPRPDRHTGSALGHDRRRGRGGCRLKSNRQAERHSRSPTRFSQPNEPAALVLPRAHRIHGRNPAPEKFETIGRPSAAAPARAEAGPAAGRGSDRSRRRLGVDQSTLARWERGEREATGKFLRGAKRFLATTTAANGVRIA